jgi:dTDP-4-amino-4,6-dideoxygalactose transaminase
VNYRTGEHGRSFEREYADYLGVRGAVALMNGTIALEAALRALGVGVGDDVVVPCRTFIATASSVAAVGARPILADIDARTQCLTASTLSAVLTERTRAVIAVHLGGMVCDMDPIVELCRGKGIYVIEDCAQAHGARYKGRAVGSLGDIAAFSFCQDKIITTGGEGGLVASNDEVLLDFIVRMKDHGKDPVLASAPHRRGGFAYLHTSFGTNWRMTEMQSALGRHQLARLDESVVRRRENAVRIVEAVADIPGIEVSAVPEWAYCAYYKLYLWIDTERLVSEWNRDRIVEALIAENIWAGTGSCPDIGYEVAFDGVESARARRPAAESLAQRSLMLHVHPTLEAYDIDDAVLALRKVMAHATGSSDG